MWCFSEQVTSVPSCKRKSLNNRNLLSIQWGAGSISRAAQVTQDRLQAALSLQILNISVVYFPVNMCAFVCSSAGGAEGSSERNQKVPKTDHYWLWDQLPCRSSCMFSLNWNACVTLVAEFLDNSSSSAHVFCISNFAFHWEVSLFYLVFPRATSFINSPMLLPTRLEINFSPWFLKLWWAVVMSFCNKNPFIMDLLIQIMPDSWDCHPHKSCYINQYCVLLEYRLDKYWKS